MTLVKDTDEKRCHHLALAGFIVSGEESNLQHQAARGSLQVASPRSHASWVHHNSRKNDAKLLSDVVLKRDIQPSDIVERCAGVLQ